MQVSRKTPDHAKTNGVHYTPPDLAGFLAEATAAVAGKIRKPIRVLDPACGDGGLLLAIAEAVPARARRGMILEGYDTDPGELAKAGAALARAGVSDVVLHNRDFLSEDGFGNGEPTLFEENRP